LLLNDEFDHESLAGTINRLFNELGAVPAEDVAREAIARNLIPAELLAKLQLRGVTAYVRRALARDTPDGVPFAQPLADTPNAPWQQMTMFRYDELCDLMKRRAKGIYYDLERLRKLHDFCLSRFGKAPAIPELLMPDEWNDDEDDEKADENEE
jgi:hypothetical protein